MSESKVYENKPRCADGCIPYEYCAEQVSQTGKAYRKCHKCDNFTNPPKKDRCPDDTPCQTWEEAAASEFTSKAGVIYRKCAVCDNLVFDNSNKNKKAKRPPPPSATTSASSSTSTDVKLDNLNVRLMTVEAAMKELKDGMDTLSNFLTPK